MRYSSTDNWLDTDCVGKMELTSLVQGTTGASLDSAIGARLSQPQHVRLRKHSKCNPDRIYPPCALRLGQPRSDAYHCSR